MLDAGCWMLDADAAEIFDKNLEFGAFLKDKKKISEKLIPILIQHPGSSIQYPFKLSTSCHSSLVSRHST
jgi:hypothetical protein